MTGRWRLYRCGAEEACAVAAVVFASVGAAFATELVGTPQLAHFACHHRGRGGELRDLSHVWFPIRRPDGSGFVRRSAIRIGCFTGG